MNRMYQASGPALCHLPKARWLAALVGCAPVPSPVWDLILHLSTASLGAGQAIMQWASELKN